MMMSDPFGGALQWGSLPVIGLAVLALTGCSPSSTTELPEARLSVGMPTGSSSDPGQLTDTGIAPPEVATVQAGAGNQRPGAVEIVPTPKPHPDASAAGAKPELVPTPKGIPAGEGTEVPIGAPPDFRNWPEPDLTLFVTGQQHGYLEPCGCTGLDRQKGGVARRFTLMNSLRRLAGWELLPIDVGNQVRRFGRQAEIKLQQTTKALKEMEYDVVGLGPDDLRLGVGELLAVAAGENPQTSMYLSANVVLIDPDLMPQSRVIQRGSIKVGVTTVLDPESLADKLSEEILVNPPVESLKAALQEINKQQPDVRVVAYFGKEESAKQLMRDVPGFDLIIVAGGYGEPTFQAQAIDQSKAKMIVTGDKGMYAGLVGLYKHLPMKYARVALTHEFADAPQMRRLMADYQNQLRDLGLETLGLKPIPHPSGGRFVGSAKCGECHTTAYDIWESTPHVDATADIVKPPKERGDVARHFDPECLSCHVTGWNPQNYYPYLSGYLSLESSAHLTGNGCENCHGPGLAHSEAESGDASVNEQERDRLRKEMKLSFDDAREKCLECHDLDNSPDFHEDDAFEDIYWPEIEHYGLD